MDLPADANNKKIWQPVPTRQQMIEDSHDHLLTCEDELEQAYNIIKQYPRRITFFGAARATPDDPYYQMAQELAARLSRQGFAIVSGGGGGMMEAANKGAYEAGGDSIGFNIQLPHEQSLNDYTTDNLAFYYFFTRKVMMTFYAHAYIFMPGGLGTFDEFFEVVTLIQTRKMAPAPVFAVGADYWNGLNDYLRQHQVSNGYVTDSELDIYTITDDIDMICDSIAKSADKLDDDSASPSPTTNDAVDMTDSVVS